MAGSLGTLIHTGGTQEPLIPAAHPCAPSPAADIQPLSVHVHAHTRGEERPHHCKYEFYVHIYQEKRGMTAALSRPGAHIPNQEKRLGDASADSVQRGVPLPPPAPLPAPGGAARRGG